MSTSVEVSSSPRVVCWFSCGDASAVACKLALLQHPDAVIVRIHLDDEHEDNQRFAADCARWYGREIVTLRSSEYRDCFDVWEQRRYMSGVAGATCTGALKKAVRFEFQRPDDIHVWGYTADEAERAARFRRNNPELECEFPLVDRGLSKPDCHAIVRAAGIALPAMYLLGFPNNNCRGCVKAAGAGYWNLVRVHFPERFQRIAALSRQIGCRLVKLKGARIFLDELPADAGRKPEHEESCSPFCETTLAEIA
jgi:hypothetical protein